ncbi:MAG: hypothetical protein AAF533_23205 [Acidobacteriota bacterium]
MSDLRDLIERLGDEEERHERTPFLAPCIAGGELRVRVGGLIRSFRVVPDDLEGWGLFEAVGQRRTRRLEEPDLPLVDAYLSLFPVVRLHLGRLLTGRSWLAWPVSGADLRQRLKRSGAVVVHLVEGGAPLDTVRARFDGAAFWHEDLDRRADPLLAEELRDDLREGVEANALRRAHLTPELRSAYGLAWAVSPAGRRELERRREEERRRRNRQRRRQDEARRHDRERRRRQAEIPPPRPGSAGARRLEDALALAGGALIGCRDHGGHWVVEWQGRDGQRHHSAVSKDSLTVVSAGLCLSGQDRDFDLQSLVSVVERAPGWAWD